MTHKKTVFISCGQWSEEEKQLGKDICELVKANRPDLDAYFAENQSTTESLSSNILNALYRAAAFICVMHKRGSVTASDGSQRTRASVWIEQEIAILAFMQHVLNRPVPVFLFQEKGISLEGIRSLLQLNPYTFEKREDVLERLRARLSIDPIDAIRPFTVEIFRDKDALIKIDVKNTGKKRLKNLSFWVNLPKLFVDRPIEMRHFIDTQRSTETHYCIWPVGLHISGQVVSLEPGRKTDLPFNLSYFLQGKNLTEDVLNTEFTVEVICDSEDQIDFRFFIRDAITSVS